MFTGMGNPGFENTMTLSFSRINSQSALLNTIMILSTIVSVPELSPSDWWCICRVDVDNVMGCNSVSAGDGVYLKVYNCSVNVV